ncbi:MAG: hypothetical protein JW869_04880 [Candidatus Omnitrophica bacterium]|nr:hypothetical protein [Candidatus Omnitrophota bacterium]
MNQDYEFVHNLMLDSCSFDASATEEKSACEQILKWETEGIIIPIIPHSVMKEIGAKSTPLWKKEKARGFVTTYDIGLTPEQKTKLEEINKIIAGRGKEEKYHNDALHILISQDSGEYFVTADIRLIDKREEIYKVLPGIKIVKPSEFVKIVEEDKNQWVRRKEWRKRQGLPPDFI